MIVRLIRILVLAIGFAILTACGGGSGGGGEAPAAATLDPIELVSADSSGLAGDGSSQDPAVSGDGRYVTFWSSATNLVANDTNGQSDIFVRDRQTGTTRRVSVAADGAEANGFSDGPAISADGNYVVFYSSATNLVTVAHLKYSNQ